MALHPFLERLGRGEILAGDGAMGTELQARGLAAGACPELLNVTQPDLVQAIHRDYFAAGSDLVETNSFGGTRPRLARHGLQDRVAELARGAAELARRECPPGRFVAGSIGPTGEVLEPFGDVSAAQSEALFAEQAEALAAGGVDLFFVETMMAAEEAVAAVRAAKATGLPVVATMTFNAGAGGVRTSWGVDAATAVQVLTDAGADALGANCGCGFDEMLLVMQAMRPLTALPLVAQANAGTPQIQGGVTVFPETPAQMRAKAAKLLALGVNFIGGCCGTGPAHIRVLRELVDSRRR